MHCYICDKELSEKEEVWNTEINGFEACSTCLEVIMDTAYSDGFVRPDDGEENILFEEDLTEDEARQYYLPLKELYTE